MVGRDDDGQVMVARGEGEAVPLPLKSAKDFDVYERREIQLSRGDRVRITRNGIAADGKGKLMNGSLHSVAGFNRAGDIKLDNGQVISKEFGHLSHGYCTTSHAAQGKTVDRVLVAVGPESFAAASQEQFYVSVSRGRESVTVYCQDKQELLEAVSRSGARLTATELTKQAEKAPPSRMVKVGEHIRRTMRANLVRGRSEKRDVAKGRDKVQERIKERGLER